MRCVRVIGAACVAVAAVTYGDDVAGAQTSMSDEWTERYLFFSGLDLWRGGGFGHGGLLWSPGGLDREGFTLKTFIGAGSYRYQAGATGVVGTEVVAAAMPGWRFKREALEVTLFAGLDVQHHQLAPDDPGNRLRGGHAGARAAADLWWEPSATSMVSGAISVSTIGASYWTRGAMGWRFLDVVYLGPEVHALGGGSYRQFRFGVHATALQAGGFEWSAGLGQVTDSDHSSGLYGRIGLLTRR